MNKYAMQAKLASGGYANVYKCTNPVGTSYVCKVITKLKLPEHRIRQEVAAMEKLQRCVYVPRLVDYFEDAEAHYIVQEYCRGISLEFKAHDEFLTSLVARELLRAMYELHETGVMHCDIKHGNIIFNKRDHTIKIIDFGNAQLEPPPVITVKLMGTPLFMAPEQLNHTCVYETDVWGVGIIVYHMLAGTSPFDTYKEIFSNEPTLHGITWREISDNAKDFVQLCLTKEHKQRPSAETLLNHPWLASL